MVFRVGELGVFDTVTHPITPWKMSSRASVSAGFGCTWKRMGAADGRIESASPGRKIASAGVLTFAKSSEASPETTRMLVLDVSLFPALSVA